LTLEDKKHKYRREIVIAEMYQEHYRVRSECYCRERYADKDTELLAKGVGLLAKLELGRLDARVASTGEVPAAGNATEE
jgi:hypothetical protein